MPKEKYEKPVRQHSFMSAADVAAGKPTTWNSIEITGFVCNVSLELFQFNHLTSLFLNDNQLKVLPPDVCRLTNLNCLDVSSNQLRSLPMELGDLIELKELILKYNQLTSLPFELGKLFQLYLIDIQGNPLPSQFYQLCNNGNGTQNLVQYLLNNLPCEFCQIICD